MRTARHVQVEGRLRRHRRAVHEKNGSFGGVAGVLAPEKKLDVALASPVFGAVHGGVMYPGFYARIRREQEEARWRTASRRWTPFRSCSCTTPACGRSVRPYAR